MSKTLLFQTILFSIQKSSIANNLFKINTSLKFKTVQFQAIQFSISTQFSSNWPIDKTLSGATTPGQSGPGNYGIEEELCIL